MESDLIGKWVVATYTYGGVAVWDGGANGDMVYGVLESADEAAILIRQANGETAYLPAATIRELRAMPPPESGPENSLLRSTDSPSETLLRSTLPCSEEPDRLLRPEAATEDVPSL